MFNVKLILHFAIIFGSYFLNCIASSFPISNATNSKNNSVSGLPEDVLNNSKSSLEQLNVWSDKEFTKSMTYATDYSIFDIRVDTLPDECKLFRTPLSCAEATACTKRSGYYYLQMNHINNSFILVECYVPYDGGAAYTVIQRRQDGSVDFYRPWADYKKGFGDIEGEFFIGLEPLYALTNFYGPQELMILMEQENSNSIISAHAKYDSFAIGREEEKYILKRIGKFSGSAGDSLHVHVGMEFSTKDRDHNNCAQLYLGGWWYKKCHHSNLNGHYGDVEYGKGINWLTWTGFNESLKYVKMMIRRRKD